MKAPLRVIAGGRVEEEPTIPTMGDSVHSWKDIQVTFGSRTLSAIGQVEYQGRIHRTAPPSPSFPLICVGIDPSPGANLGYAAIRWDGRRAHWIAGGKTDDPELIDERLFAQAPDLVCIEWPAIQKRQAAKAAMATMAVAGKLEGLALARRLAVEKIPPHAWRKAVLGRTRRTEYLTIDAIAKMVLMRAVTGMPKVGGHVVDAAGVALCGARAWRRRVA